MYCAAADEDDDDTPAGGGDSGIGGKRRTKFQEILDTVRLCHNDLYLCWKKLQVCVSVGV